MDSKKPKIDFEKYKEAVDEYLSGAFDPLVEPQHVREKDPLEETMANHIKRNELLLKEPAVHDPNDYQANLYARLLTIVREKRVNKYHNRSDEMRDSIRQLFEINTQLQTMTQQNRNEVQRPPDQFFINTTDFHNDSYSQFVHDVEKIEKSKHN
ncbi:hypothetical protein M3Y97_00037700 [Aphelenchoides bicaudatus]|nr:hypothetical protein M3Y97_00037700 [Aphelenchoides bicaudatus]